MVTAHVNPDARVDHVGRRHALPWCARVPDRPCDPFEMFDSYAEIVAHIGECDLFAVEGVQNEPRVLAPIVAEGDPKCRSETLTRRGGARLVRAR
jgi:hypothetical protein